MNKYIHCAFVRHEDFERAYLFAVPVEDKIKKDTKVICHTRYGEQEGKVVSDSFWVSEEALESICSAIGAKCPLNDIIGTFETRTVTSKSYFGGIPDTEANPVDVPF